MSATAGNNFDATVSWSAPAGNGGTAVTGYVITPYKSGVAQTAVTVGNVTSYHFAGLTCGGSYTFTVAAKNAAGTGSASSQSNNVAPNCVPGTPNNAGATAGNNSDATVSWIAPAGNGGTAVTNYVITPYKAGVAQTAVTVGNVTSYDVTGLTCGASYTFTVAAKNAAGAQTVRAAAPPPRATARAADPAQAPPG